MSKLTLKHPKDAVPHAALAVLELAGARAAVASAAADVPAARLERADGEPVCGDSAVARHLVATLPECQALDARDEHERKEIDALVAEADALTASSDAAMLEAALEALNARLTLRSFVAGRGTRASLADAAVWAAHARVGHARVDALAEQHKLKHVSRWRAHVAACVGESGLADKSAPIKTEAGVMGAFKHIAACEPGSVVTRFPPEPSGYLHIGHVKAAMLNDHYARSNGGRLHCRFDDTNPAAEKAEFEDAILHDLARLNIVPDSVSHTSDYFGKFLEYAEQFLRAGHAYIDDTPIDEMREQRMVGKAGKCRDNTVEQNLAMWKEMVEGTAKGQKCVMRAKIDIAHSNSAMRDPSMYRCVVSPPHHRTGSKFKAYPLYDFACPIIDSIEGITHALRSSEYTSRNPLYTWVAETAGLRVPTIEDFSRLNFEYVLLSKRKLNKLVQTGVVGGWDDPRFPTIRGVLRRGIEVDVLRQFILAQGGSKNTVLMTMDKLWILNKNALDKRAPRHVALGPVDELVPLTLSGDGVPSGVDVRAQPLHPKNPDMGTRADAYCATLWLDGRDVALLADGEEVTLVNWGNAVLEVEKDAAGKVKSVTGRLNLDGDPRKTKHKLTWLPRIGDGTPGNDDGHLLHVTMREYGFLITKKTLAADDDFDACVNRNSLLETKAFGAPSLRQLQKGDKLQLFRIGYFIVDDAGDGSAERPLVLIKIPDGSGKGPLDPKE